jgi:hypothetical protein
MIRYHHQHQRKSQSPSEDVPPVRFSNMITCIVLVLLVLKRDAHLPTSCIERGFASFHLRHALLLSMVQSAISGEVLRKCTWSWFTNIKPEQ